MDWGVLVVLALVAWTVVAFGVGMVFGRVVRRRDRHDGHDRSGSPDAAGDDAGGTSPTDGRE